MTVVLGVGVNGIGVRVVVGLLVAVDNTVGVADELPVSGLGVAVSSMIACGVTVSGIVTPDVMA
ncbi:hypothetical protein ACFLXI_03680 [Chloroflexota bacterium]